MNKNLSQQNKAKLLENLAAIKAYLKGADAEDAARLIACVEELEADLRARRYGLVYEEHREEIEELLERCNPILTEEGELHIDNGGICHALIDGDNLAASAVRCAADAPVCVQHFGEKVPQNYASQHGQQDDE